MQRLSEESVDSYYADVLLVPPALGQSISNDHTVLSLVLIGSRIE